MQRLPVQDDNLRLILSKGHEEWLAREIRDRFVAMAIMVLLCGAFVAALGAILLSEREAENAVYVRAGESETVISGLEADGYTVVVGMPPEADQAENGWWTAGQGLIFVAALALVVATPLVLVKFALEIRKLRRWRTEHEAFLESYNRGETGPA